MMLMIFIVQGNLKHVDVGNAASQGFKIPRLGPKLRRCSIVLVHSLINKGKEPRRRTCITDTTPLQLPSSTPEAECLANVLLVQSQVPLLTRIPLAPIGEISFIMRQHRDVNVVELSKTARLAAGWKTESTEEVPYTRPSLSQCRPSITCRR